MPYKYNPFTGNFDYYESSVTTAPGGSDTQLQYNNGGAFGGISESVYNDATAGSGVDETLFTLSKTLSATGVDVGTDFKLDSNILTVDGSFTSTGNDGGGIYTTKLNHLIYSQDIENFAAISAHTYYGANNAITSSGNPTIRGVSDTSVTFQGANNQAWVTATVPTDGDSPQIYIYGTKDTAYSQVTVTAPATPYIQVVGTEGYASRISGATPDITIGGNFSGSGGTLNYGIQATGTTAAIRAIGHILPFSNNSYTLGNTINRMSNVYSVLGNFSSTVTVGSLTASRGVYTGTGGLLQTTSNWSYDGTHMQFASNRMTIANSDGANYVLSLSHTGGTVTRNGLLLTSTGTTSTTTVLKVDTGSVTNAINLTGDGQIGIGTTPNTTRRVSISYSAASNATHVGLRTDLTLTGAISGTFPTAGNFTTSVNAGVNTLSFSSGVFFSNRSELTQSGTQTEQWGVYGDAWHRSQGNVGTLGAGRGFVNIVAGSAGTITNTTTWQGVLATNAGGTQPTITTASLLDVYVSHAGTGTIGNLNGLLVNGYFSAGSGTITTYTGTRVNNPGSGATITNLYGHYIADLTRGSNNYGIYFAGTGTGNGINWGGSTAMIHATSTSAISVTGNTRVVGSLNVDTANSTVYSSLTVGGSGGSNAGFEVSVSSGITLQAYNRNTSAYASLNMDGSLINIRPSGTTMLTADGTNGLTLGASGGKVGLYAVTPVVRATTAGAAATFVANTSGLANDTATFDGYTIGQVVKALRNLGILT